MAVYIKEIITEVKDRQREAESSDALGDMPDEKIEEIIRLATENVLDRLHREFGD